MKNVICIINLILFSSCLSSCNLGSRSRARIANDVDTVDVTVEKIKISSSNELLLNSYYLTTSFRMDSSDIMVAYNDKSDALDIIDMEKHSTSQIKLATEGPSGIPRRLDAIFVQNLDSIWLYSDDVKTIFFINGEGMVKDKIQLKTKPSEEVIVTVNHAISVVKLYYNLSRNALFYTVVDLSSSIPRFIVKELSLGNKQIVNEYELASSVVESNPRKGYANKGNPNVTFTYDKIVYNYPIESHIYTIDLNTGKSDVYEADSRFTENRVHRCLSQTDYSMWERHELENIHFCEVMYLPEIEMYARLHLGAVEYDTQKSWPALFDSKKIYLTIFDKDFKEVNEIELPTKRYCYFTAWCALGNGILLFVDNSLSEEGVSDDLFFDIYRPVRK